MFMLVLSPLSGDRALFHKRNKKGCFSNFDVLVTISAEAWSTDCCSDDTRLQAEAIHTVQQDNPHRTM